MVFDFRFTFINMVDMQMTDFQKIILWIVILIIVFIVTILIRKYKEWMNG